MTTDATSNATAAPALKAEHPVVKLMQELLESKGITLTDEDNQLLREKAAEMVDRTPGFYDPSREIAITWTVDDMLTQRPDLTEEEAMAALLQAEHDHDTERGINWTTLKKAADDLYEPRYVAGTFVLEGGAEAAAYVNLSTGDVVERGGPDDGHFGGSASGTFVFDGCHQPAEEVELGQVCSGFDEDLVELTKELLAAGARIGSKAELEASVSAPRPSQG